MLRKPAIVLSALSLLLLLASLLAGCGGESDTGGGTIDPEASGRATVLELVQPG